MRLQLNMDGRKRKLAVPPRQAFRLRPALFSKRAGLETNCESLDFVRSNEKNTTRFAQTSDFSLLRSSFTLKFASPRSTGLTCTSLNLARKHNELSLISKI